jgi:hypothetical protein
MIISQKLLKECVVLDYAEVPDLHVILSLNVHFDLICRARCTNNQHRSRIDVLVAVATKSTLVYYDGIYEEHVLYMRRGSIGFIPRSAIETKKELTFPMMPLIGTSVDSELLLVFSDILPRDCQSFVSGVTELILPGKDGREQYKSWTRHLKLLIVQVVLTSENPYDTLIRIATKRQVRAERKTKPLSIAKSKEMNDWILKLIPKLLREHGLVR